MIGSYNGIADKTNRLQKVWKFIKNSYLKYVQIVIYDFNSVLITVSSDMT